MATRSKTSRRESQKGSSFIEFALGSVILIPLLFGTMDFGRLFYASIEVANAAATGANYGSSSSSNVSTSGLSTSVQAAIQTAAQNDAPNLSGMTVTSTEVCQDSSGNSASCTTAGAYQYVSVTASYTFQTLFNYPRIASSVALSKTVMMRAK